MTDFVLKDFKEKLGIVGKVFEAKIPHGLDAFYSSFVFDGTHVYASSHEVGISVEMPLDFSCVVEGKTLLELLAVLQGDVISLLLKNNTLELTAGNSVVNLPVLDIDKSQSLKAEFEVDGVDSMQLSDAKVLSNMFSDVSGSTSAQDPRTAVRSIHVIQKSDCLLVYGSDGRCLARVKSQDVKLSFLQEDKPLLLNPVFCKIFDVVLQYADENSDCCISLGDVVKIKIAGISGTFVIQSASIKDTTIVFDDVFNKIQEEIAGVDFMEIPTEFPSLFSHAKILLHSVMHPTAEITVKEGLLSVFSGRIDLRGTLKSSEVSVNLKDIAVKVQPFQVLMYLSLGATHFGFAKGFLVMKRDDNAVFIVMRYSD